MSRLRNPSRATDDVRWHHVIHRLNAKQDDPENRESDAVNPSELHGDLRVSLLIRCPARPEVQTTAMEDAERSTGAVRGQSQEGSRSPAKDDGRSSSQHFLADVSGGQTDE